MRSVIGAVLGPLWNDPRGRPLLFVSGLALIGICALLCFILALVFISDRTPPVIPPDAPEVVVRETEPPVTDTVVIRINQTSQPAPIPNRLNIGNNTYQVLPMGIQGERWEYDPSAERTVFWVPGTIVNYVIGMHASPENLEVIAALNRGDLITLDTSLGIQRYRVAERLTFRNDETSALLEQSIPRLTLVMLGERGDERQVVFAPFTDESTPNQLTALGTLINLGDVQVRAINSRLLPGASIGLDAQKSYLQVDFEVTNIVTRILDASQFFSELADPTGTVFPLSRQASAIAGGRGFTQGALQPDETITATAGFELPITLSASSLEWRFAIDSASPYIAKVAIPYRPIVLLPTPIPTERPVAEVNITSVQISPEGTELRVVGVVRNLTTKFLSGSLQDVSLRGPEGQLYPLNSSLPAFPWNITPGESLVFQLSFARPQTAQPVIFTLFGQSYRVCEPGQPCE